ncbi:hypothetical protein BU17DRAFT_71184 [Hysterangium stoloniferum]|nr:hypothetical protein BU17DRAFT_71184 [Hysterangium stoloniferum]
MPRPFACVWGCIFTHVTPSHSGHVPLPTSRRFAHVTPPHPRSPTSLRDTCTTLRDRAHYVTNARAFKHNCFYRTIRSYHINTSLSLLIGPLALSSGLEYILIISKAFSVFHLKASSKHPGQFQYFISKLLQNIQDNFRRPFDSLVVISSQSFFTIFRTFSIFSSYNILPISKIFSIIKLGTSDILQDSWSSSNAIQQAFYKGFTFLLIGSLHSNGFTF